MTGLRTHKLHKKYKKYQRASFRPGQCVLCDKVGAKTLKNFRHWRIVRNLFPWNRVAKIQHLIIPKRHAMYPRLNNQERKELEKIKLDYLNNQYDVLAEATPRIQSVPEHFHLHLIVLK